MRRFQRIRLRHGDDVVATIDKMDFAGDAGRQVRAQIKPRAAEFFQSHAAAERRIFLLEGEHIARIANAGAGQSADRAGRDRVDADLLVTEIDGEIAHRRFERRLRQTHDVVIGHGAIAAIVSERDQRAAIGHQRRRALGALGEGEAGDHHGADEVLAGVVGEAALEFVLVRETDRVDEKVDGSPLLLERGKNSIDGRNVLDVAGHQHGRADGFGERLDALQQRIALISEGQLGAVGAQHLGDAPGDRVVVGDPHDQAAFSVHQSRHGSASKFVREKTIRRQRA